MIALEYENICVTGKGRRRWDGGGVMGETADALKQCGGQNYSEER